MFTDPVSRQETNVATERLPVRIFDGPLYAQGQRDLDLEVAMGSEYPETFKFGIVDTQTGRVVPGVYERTVYGVAPHPRYYVYRGTN